MRRFALLPLLIAALGCSCQAANIIYNNLTTTGTFSTDPIGSNDPKFVGALADSFSTGGSSYMFEQLTLNLEDRGAPGGGSFTAYLLSDNMTAPGSVLDTIGTIKDTSLTGSPGYYSLSLKAPFTLAANTRYWIELMSDNSVAGWVWPGDPGGVGEVGEYFAQAGVAIPNFNPDGTSNFPYQMEISDTASIATPEPGSIFLMGSGLAGMIGILRRRLFS